MAIGTYGMDFQSRVPLPGLARSEDDWRLDFAQIISNRYRARKPYEYMVFNEVVVKTKEIVVHTFRQGDVDDPDLYAAEPLYNWQKSPQGEWVMEHSVEPPVWHRMADPSNYGHKYIITATLVEKKLTEYYLRFGNPVERIT
jgi:hypothetical protein